MTVLDTRTVAAGPWDGPARPVDPTTLAPLGEVPATPADELDVLVDRARCALARWSRDHQRRANLMRAWADALRSDATGLVDDLVRETGKPVSEAHREVAAAADALDFNSGLARLGDGAASTLSDGTMSRLVREPLGVTLFLVPWNWPVLLLLRDLAPALAAGVTAIVKPAPQTTLVTRRVVNLAHRAGVPDDAVALACGDVAVAQHLIAHPTVRGMAFTGSSEVGAKVLASAATTMTRPLLELGGKNPAILLPDADLDTVLPRLARAVTITAGQMCMACSRVLVSRGRAAETVESLTEQFAGMRTGDPADPTTDLGPLISPAHASRVRGFIERARQDAEVRGGDLTHPGIAGHVLEPAVVVEPPAGAEIVGADVFGPVVTVETYDDLDDAVQRANATSYGLVAAVWARDTAVAADLATRIDAGTVWINGWGSSYPEVPAGGFKNSGLGRTRGLNGVHQFTELKHIHFS